MPEAFFRVKLPALPSVGGFDASLFGQKIDSRFFVRIEPPVGKSNGFHKAHHDRPVFLGPAAPNGIDRQLVVRYHIDKPADRIEALFFSNIIERQRKRRGGDLSSGQDCQRLWRATDIDQLVITWILQSLGLEDAPKSKGGSRGKTICAERCAAQIFVRLIILDCHDVLTETIDDPADDHSQYIMAGKNYKTYEDLRGATLGANSLTAGTAFALRRVLKAKGLEYPRDYKLINVGGSPQALTALAAGQIAAAPLSLPLNYVAEEQGLNTIGRFIDVIPHYQLSVYSVRRGWAEENRPVVVRFMKAIALANRWLYANKEAAIDLLAKETRVKPAYARKGWEFYTEKGLWHPNGDVTFEGLQVVSQIYAEQNQAKGPLPNPAKYVDQSYLREALRELSSR